MRAQYDALVRAQSARAPRRRSSGPDRRVKIVARMGVGYDSVDVPACTGERRHPHQHARRRSSPGGHEHPRCSSSRSRTSCSTKDAITRTGRWAETTNAHGCRPDAERRSGRSGSATSAASCSACSRRSTWCTSRSTRTPRRKTPRSCGVRLTDKDTVLRESDFVCVNTPLTPETRRLDRRARVLADEADGVLHQHGARARSSTRRRCTRRWRSGASPAPRSTSSSRSRSAPTIRSWRWTTSS